MENLYYDIIHLVSIYLSDKDLYHFLISNKFLFQYIHIYYKRKTIKYDNIIRYNLKEHYIYHLHVTCSYMYEYNMNLFEKLYYKFKYYFRCLIKRTYMNNIYRYTIIVNPVNLNISKFSNLTKIIFDDYFDQEINFPFPSQVKHIVFGKRFNHPIDSLPDSIQKIEFVHRSFFNQKINTYPCSLKEIIYSRLYLYDINNLPDSTEIINMKYSDFNHTTIYKLPEKLKLLVLTGNHRITCNINENVKVFVYELSNVKFNSPCVHLTKWRYSYQYDF